MYAYGYGVWWNRDWETNSLFTVDLFLLYFCVGFDFHSFDGDLTEWMLICMKFYVIDEFFVISYSNGILLNGKQYELIL